MGSSEQTKSSSARQRATRVSKRIEAGPEGMFLTAGGRIRCAQCTKTSKRTGQRCRAPISATSGATGACRFHGGASTGPKTEAGRQRCAEAKTLHGRETRQIRAERQETLKRLADFETLAREMLLIRGPKQPGRRPK
jgi:hypothetical protein